MKGVKEDLFDVMARLGEVERAGERLGITPQEVAQRIHPGLMAYRKTLNGSDPRGLGYELMRYIRDAARALT